MRALVILVPLILSGCLGGSVPQGVPPAPTDRGVVDVLVTDDELQPVPRATVFLNGSPFQYETDAGGRASLSNVTPGSHELRAWAPAYYRDAVPVEVQKNRSVEVHVTLARRPDDKMEAATVTEHGYCSIAARADPPLSNVECNNPGLFPPPSKIVYRFSEGADEHGVAMRFHNASLLVVFENAQDANQALEMRLLPNGSFADGTSVRTLPGRGPFTFQFERDDLGTGWLDGGHRLEFQPVPRDLGGPVPGLVRDLSFHGNFTTVKQKVAPPNPSWDEP